MLSFLGLNCPAYASGALPAEARDGGTTSRIRPISAPALVPPISPLIITSFRQLLLCHLIITKFYHLLPLQYRFASSPPPFISTPVVSASYFSLYRSFQLFLQDFLPFLNLWLHQYYSFCSYAAKLVYAGMS